jgi:predicted DNA-binding mobile mystery protein A
MKTQIRKLHLKHVTARLETLKTHDVIGRPPIGWIKFIREALNMSSKALAKRVGVSPNTMSETEKAEIEDSITLKRLRKVADSLNCDLVYYLYPREDINKMIDKQALHISIQKVRDTQAHMELEDQAVTKEFLDERLKEEIDQIKMSKKLWDE